MGAAGSLISLLIIALISFAPLTASTFVAGRMGYRGMGLIAPWAAVVGLGILVGFGLAWLGDIGDRARRTPMTGLWAGGMLFSGYIITLTHLIVLAARRLPSRSADAANVF